MKYGTKICLKIPAKLNNFSDQNRNSYLNAQTPAIATRYRMVSIGLYIYTGYRIYVCMYIYMYI